MVEDTESQSAALIVKACESISVDMTVMNGLQESGTARCQLEED